MIFPYWKVQRGSETRLLPLIPIRIHGPATSIDVVALVDSGAEHNVFGEELADRLGISLKTGQPVVVIGVSEHDLPSILVHIDLQVGKHRWTAPTVFCRELKQRAILGQAGFFASYTVTFRYRRRQIIVRRDRPV